MFTFEMKWDDTATSWQRAGWRESCKAYAIERMMRWLDICHDNGVCIIVRLVELKD